MDKGTLRSVDKFDKFKTGFKLEENDYYDWGFKIDSFLASEQLILLHINGSDSDDLGLYELCLLIRNSGEIQSIERVINMVDYHSLKIEIDGKVYENIIDDEYILDHKIKIMLPIPSIIRNKIYDFDDDCKYEFDYLRMYENFNYRKPFDFIVYKHLYPKTTFSKLYNNEKLREVLEMTHREEYNSSNDDSFCNIKLSCKTNRREGIVIEILYSKKIDKPSIEPFDWVQAAATLELSNWSGTEIHPLMLNGICEVSYEDDRERIRYIGEIYNNKNYKQARKFITKKSVGDIKVTLVVQKHNKEVNE